MRSRARTTTTMERAARRHATLDGSYGSLVGKSLVLAERGSHGDMRSRLLVPLRQYAAGRLDHAGETEALRAKDAYYFIWLGEEAEPLSLPDIDSMIAAPCGS